MSRRGDQARQAEAVALAEEFSRLAGCYRDFALDRFFPSALLIDLALDLNRVFDPDRVLDPNRRVLDLNRVLDLSLIFDRPLAHDLAHVCADARDLAFDRDLVRDVPRVRAIARAIARDLDHAAVALRGRYGHTAEARILVRLAGWLPPGERSRFVAEQLANLGCCERWWQRVNHLVGVAIGTPRLAWMMRREGHRRGA